MPMLARQLFMVHCVGAGAFAISALVIGWMVVDSLSSARRWRKEAQRLEALRSDVRGTSQP